MVAGAAVLLAGCLMPWLRVRADLSLFGVTGGRAATANGIDTSHGTIFLVIAVATAVLGIFALAANAGPRIGVSAVAIVGALFVGGFALRDAVSPEALAIDEVSRQLGSGAAVVGAVRLLVDRGFVSVSTEAGLWVAVAGAALTLVGAVVAATTARAAGPGPGP